MRFPWRRPTLAQALALVLAVTALSQLAVGVVLYGRLRAELERALRNLLRNALEALAGRPGRVEVGFAREDGHERISVRDDGPGLPPEAAARGLEPLRTPKPHSTGLGLALVERVAEAHGGTLCYTSPAEGAALFTLRWPARE